ncbi:hypothetical protein OC834_002453 [Tilletia horrida]|nr:hypothetical protein OC834_002453 [Tilletia horrida]
MPPKRKASASASSTKPKKTPAAKKQGPTPLPQAWVPPTAPIPPGEAFNIKPDEYYPTGNYWNALPVFKPTWEQFKDFYTYCRRIRHEGMQNGIVKIVPPKEWLDMQPDLSERLQHIRIVNPLRQMVQTGGEGTYQQTNAPQQQSYTIKEWAQLCASPAQRGPELLKIKRKLEEQYELAAQIEATDRGRKAKRAASASNSKKGATADAPSSTTNPTPSANGPGPAPSPPAQSDPSLPAAPAAHGETAQAPLPTPPQSISATSPPSNASAPSPNEQRVPSAAASPSALAHAQAQAQPPAPADAATSEAAPAGPGPASQDVPRTEHTPSASASASASALAAASSPAGSSASSASPTASAPTTDPSKDSSKSQKDWDYRRAWMYEYLPAAEADVADPSDWTIDVCSEIETEYWRTLAELRSTGSSVVRTGSELRGAYYGADQCGTLFDEDMTVWNVGRLDNPLTRMLGCIDENGEWVDMDLDDVEEEALAPSSSKQGKAGAAAAQSGKKGKGKAAAAPAPAPAPAPAASTPQGKGKGKAKAKAVVLPSAIDEGSASAIAGVTTPYLYFGMWKATFSWHVEDMDLCSINYIHFGAPKQWYAIPQKDRARFETAMAAAYPSDARRCNQFLRHKAYLVSPSRLASIHPLKMVQHAGEIVLTFPYGYHSGFNLGFNCAESTNFALDDWVDIGMGAKVCECADRESQVQIDVRRLYNEAIAAETKERKREREQDGDFVLEEDEEDESFEVDEEDEDGGGDDDDFGRSSCSSEEKEEDRGDKSKTNASKRGGRRLTKKASAAMLVDHDSDDAEEDGDSAARSPRKKARTSKTASTASPSSAAAKKTKAASPKRKAPSTATKPAAKKTTTTKESKATSSSPAAATGGKAKGKATATATAKKALAAMHVRPAAAPAAAAPATSSPSSTSTSMFSRPVPTPRTSLNSALAGMTSSAFAPTPTSASGVSPPLFEKDAASGSKSGGEAGGGGGASQSQQAALRSSALALDQVRQEGEEDGNEDSVDTIYRGEMGASGERAVWERSEEQAVTPVVPSQFSTARAGLGSPSSSSVPTLLLPTSVSSSDGAFPTSSHSHSHSHSLKEHLELRREVSRLQVEIAQVQMESVEKEVALMQLREERDAYRQAWEKAQVRIGMLEELERERERGREAGRR